MGTCPNPHDPEKSKMAQAIKMKKMKPEGLVRAEGYTTASPRPG